VHKGHCGAEACKAYKPDGCPKGPGSPVPLPVGRCASGRMLPPWRSPGPGVSKGYCLQTPGEEKGSYGQAKG